MKNLGQIFLFPFYNTSEIPPRLYLWRCRELCTKFVTNFFSEDNVGNDLKTNWLTGGILTVLWF